MHQAKILVADDSRAARAVAHRALSSAGYQITLATDGREAVEFARRERPDLVILDIQMPEMDGYTAADEILSMIGSDYRLPVVFLTKDDAQHLSALGHQLGAYLQKPVSDTQLLTTVETLLRDTNVSGTHAGNNA